MQNKHSQLEAYGDRLLGKFDRMILGNAVAPWVLAGLYSLVLLSSTVQFIAKIQNTEWSEYRQRADHDSALGRWLPDAKALHEGGDPYGERHWFPATPFVLIGLVPFERLYAWTDNITIVALAWSLLKLGAIAAGVWCVMKSAQFGFCRGAPSHAHPIGAAVAIPLGVLLLAAVYSTRPIMGDITHGNINIFVFFELALAWLLFTQKRDVWAGIVVGLAIVTKVTPGLLLLYFLYKRAGRVVAGVLLGLMLFGGIIPTLFLGYDRHLQLLVSWWGLMIEPYVHHGFVTVALENQSLPGTLVRMLSYLNVFELEHISIEQAFQYGIVADEMARPAAPWGQYLIRGANLLIVLILAFVCRTSIRNRKDPRLLLEFSLILLAMLLMSERTWKHHMTTLPIVYLATWYVLACYPWSKLFTSAFTTGLILQVAALVILKGDTLMYAGIITVGLLLCFIQNGILLARFARDEHRTQLVHDAPT